MKLGLVLTSLISLTLSLAGPAHAAGKKPKPESPGFSTPAPVRHVRVRGIETQPFNLPNGARVDLAADLNSMLRTAITATPSFSPTEISNSGGPGVEDPCGTHLEIRAAVTTLELNVASVGITFGYSPSGGNSPISSVVGKADVKIGTIAMDFSVWECVGTRCSAVAATTSSHLTAGVTLGLAIDFGVVKTGPSLVYSTPLGNALRKVMTDGMMRLATSSRLNELSWQATVREVMLESGVIWFDAGTQARLSSNQTFVIYAVTEATGVCRVYRPVAYVHTTLVDVRSSAALVDMALDSRGVHEGDLVMIKAVP